MSALNLVVLLVVMALSGCTTVKVVPESGTAGVISEKENRLTISRGNLTISIAPAETDMINYNIEGMVASFSLDIINNSDSLVTFDNESFVLIDSTSRQYYPLTPEKVRLMLAKDTYYLLPYPYVGFYYLEDYERASFRNSISSNLPYYYEIYPQDIYTRALPTDPIIPRARISGLVYFQADIHSFNSFRINVYRKGSAKSAEPDFSFPFKVIK